MSAIVKQQKAISFGIREQIRRDKIARQEMEEVELIVRVTFRAARHSHAENMLTSALHRHPNLKACEIIEGVVDKARLEDAQTYIDILQSDVGTAYMPSVEEDIPVTEYWTRKQMADYHGVTPTTITRWLKRNPIPEASKNGAQYQIPAHLARSYQPQKFKVGRKRKED